MDDVQEIKREEKIEMLYVNIHLGSGTSSESIGSLQGPILQKIWRVLLSLW